MSELLETTARIERTIEMLVHERERTERGIAQLGEALSPQGIAMRQQLEHRVSDIKRTIGEQWDQLVAIAPRYRCPLCGFTVNEWGHRDDCPHA